MPAIVTYTCTALNFTVMHSRTLIFRKKINAVHISQSLCRIRFRSELFSHCDCLRPGPQPRAHRSCLISSGLNRFKEAVRTSKSIILNLTIKVCLSFARLARVDKHRKPFARLLHRREEQVKGVQAPTAEARCQAPPPPRFPGSTDHRRHLLCFFPKRFATSPGDGTTFFSILALWRLKMLYGRESKPWEKVETVARFR